MENKDKQLNIEELFQRYPHIAKKVTVMWGSSGCRDFLNSLLVNKRSELRAGFTPNDAKLIFALLSKHDELFPQANTMHVEIPPFYCGTGKYPAYKPRQHDWSFLKWIFIFIIGLVAYAVYKSLHI